MQEVELTHGESSHPPLHDDVSDESFFDFYDFDIDDYVDEMHSDHESPIQPKWYEKTVGHYGQTRVYCNVPTTPLAHWPFRRQTAGRPEVSPEVILMGWPKTQVSSTRFYSSPCVSQLF